jgi:uncharacterized membrane protein YbaN (DUF454 family)
MIRERTLRALWTGAGALALALGLVGIFVPLLPTTPFVLLASFCFVRGSPALHARLLANRRFGPAIRDWEAGRGIPRRAKRVAIATTLVSLAFSAWLVGKALVTAMLAVLGVALVAYLARLPTGDAPR